VPSPPPKTKNTKKTLKKKKKQQRRRRDRDRDDDDKEEEEEEEEEEERNFLLRLGFLVVLCGSLLSRENIGNVIAEFFKLILRFGFFFLVLSCNLHLSFGRQEEEEDEA
jgi:hypothetical protein